MRLWNTLSWAMSPQNVRWWFTYQSELIYRVRQLQQEVLVILDERDDYRWWLARVYGRTMSDYPLATWQASDRFIQGHFNSLPKWVCPILFEADSAESLIQSMHEAGNSVHYVVDRDGSITQLVSEEHTAMLPEYSGQHDIWWDSVKHNGRPSLLIFSVAHVTDHEGKLTYEQLVASLTLIADLVRRHRIQPYEGLMQGGIILPFSLSRNWSFSNNYPLADLLAYLQHGLLPEQPVENTVEEAGQEAAPAKEPTPSPSPAPKKKSVKK